MKKYWVLITIIGVIMLAVGFTGKSDFPVVKTASFKDPVLVDTMLENSSTVRMETFYHSQPYSQVGDEFVIKANSYSIDVLRLETQQRSNSGVSGMDNPRNFGEVWSFGRAVRDTVCWEGSFPLTIEVVVADTKREVAVIDVSDSTGNCFKLPDELSDVYTRIYNYSDVIINTYRVDTYSSLTKKYISSSYGVVATEQAISYRAQRADE